MSLLLGTIVRKIPLPSSTFADLGSPTSGDAVLDLQQFKTMGDNFLEVLLKMKHNGAIDKTRAGFSALCNRLLCSDDSRYSVSFFLLSWLYFCLSYAMAYSTQLMKFVFVI